MSRFSVFAIGVLSALAMAVVALAQGPAAPPPSCDEQLDNEMFQRGANVQQLAVLRSQLRSMTKERDDLKVMLSKTKAPEKVPEKK